MMLKIKFFTLKSGEQGKVIWGLQFLRRIKLFSRINTNNPPERRSKTHRWRSNIAPIQNW